MKLEIIKNTKFDINEVYIDELLVGVFEKVSLDNDDYSFMAKCSHEKLNGDHYILIGQHLNKLNNSTTKQCFNMSDGHSIPKDLKQQQFIKNK